MAREAAQALHEAVSDQSLDSNLARYTYIDPVAKTAIKAALRLVGNCKLQIIGMGKQRIYKSDTKFKAPVAISRSWSGL